MKDIQSQHDSRRIDIRKVGVKSVTYPIIVLDKANATQQTLARMNMYVNLPHRFKGTHMSRFIEILNRFHGAFTLQTVRLILEEMKIRLEAEAAHLEIEFPYFLAHEKAGMPGLARYDCRLHGSLTKGFDLVVAVDVPLPLAAPADQSVRTSPTGLWGSVTAAVRMKRFLWIEELIGLVEDGVIASSPQPAAVESMCRQISAALQANGSFHWYKVVVKNIASGYSTCASCEWPELQPELAEGQENVGFVDTLVEPGKVFPHPVHIIH